MSRHARRNFVWPWGAKGSSPVPASDIVFMDYEIWTDSEQGRRPLTRGSKYIERSAIAAWRQKELAKPGVQYVNVSVGQERLAFNNGARAMKKNSGKDPVVYQNLFGGQMIAYPMPEGETDIQDDQTGDVITLAMPISEFVAGLDRLNAKLTAAQEPRPSDLGRFIDESFSTLTPEQRNFLFGGSSVAAGSFLFFGGGPIGQANPRHQRVRLQKPLRCSVCRDQLFPDDTYDSTRGPICLSCYRISAWYMPH